MKKKLVLRSVVVILIILNVFVVYLLAIPNDKKELEEVQTQKILESNDKQLAIWVQETNGEWHEQEDRSKWPDPSTHGFVGAECTDSEGATIQWEKVLTFSLADKTATIKTKQTSYCTLYFATGEPALDHLKKKGGSTFNSTSAVDGMYRFKGGSTAVTTNYICFGTTVESTCTGTPATYMYRIIGITSATDNTIGLYANQLKIIRAVPSNQSQVWHSDRYSDVKWDSSSAKTYLNGTFLNTIKGLADGAYWESMISSHKWYNADQTDTPGTTEPKTSQTAESKIGLMYGTDYMNANGASTSNWLFITNGWSGNPSKEEWTMSRYGFSFGGYYNAWYVSSYGSLSWDNMDRKYAVRPVFYLQSGVNLTGEGTKEHPYIITSLPNN